MKVLVESKRQNIEYESPMGTCTVPLSYYICGDEYLCPKYAIPCAPVVAPDILPRQEK